MKKLRNMSLMILSSLLICASLLSAHTQIPYKISENPVKKPFAGIKVVRQDGLWVLDLSDQGLDDVKGLTTLANIEKVQKLLLYKNNLVRLPDEVFMLPHLEELDVSHNKLTSVPSQVQRLQKLMSLNVSHNMLTSLPATIGNVTSLKHIYLECNELTTLPRELGRLENLRVLLANDNKIVHVPEVVANLSQLCVVDISNNNIKMLSDDVLNLKSTCKMLRLENNPLDKQVRDKLSMVPDCFAILTGETVRI